MDVTLIPLYVSPPLDPTHSRALGNIEYFEGLIRSEPEKYVNEADDRGKEEEGVGKTADDRKSMSEKERYESLCRGPWDLVSAVYKALKCKPSALCAGNV